jgi:hypothetical protein
LYLYFYFVEYSILESSGFNPFSTNNDPANKSTTNEVEGKFTPLILAQHILSKSNLEHLFDALSEQPKLVANGCDFLINVLDLLGRYMPVSICISLTSSSEDKSESKDENERMEVTSEEENKIFRKYFFFYLRSMMKEILYQ